MATPVPPSHNIPSPPPSPTMKESGGRSKGITPQHPHAEYQEPIMQEDHYGNLDTHIQQQRRRAQHRQQHQGSKQQRGQQKQQESMSTHTRNRQDQSGDHQDEEDEEHSRFLAHLTSHYPILQDTFSQFQSKTPQIIQLPITFGYNITNTVVSPFLPTITSSPIISRLDNFGDALLDRLDHTIPLITSPTEEIKRKVIDEPVHQVYDRVITRPVTTIKQTKDTYTEFVSSKVHTVLENIDRDIVPVVGDLTDEYVKVINDILEERVKARIKRSKEAQQQQSPQRKKDTPYPPVAQERDAEERARRNIEAYNKPPGNLSYSQAVSGESQQTKEKTPRHREEIELERTFKILVDILNELRSYTQRKAESVKSSAQRNNIVETYNNAADTVLRTTENIAKDLEARYREGVDKARNTSVNEVVEAGINMVNEQIEAGKRALHRGMDKEREWVGEDAGKGADRRERIE